MIEYCSLASGSSGNCHFVKSENVSLLVDVGMTAKYIKEALWQIGEDMAHIQAVFITHEHIDHVRGLAVLARKYPFHIYMHESIYVNERLSLMGLDKERFSFLQPGRLTLEDLEIEVFEVPHDAEVTFGYTFTQGEKKLGIATDIGVISEQMAEHLSDCDFLVLESNHDENLVQVGRYPYYLKQRILSETGHLSNKNAGEFLARIIQKHQRLKCCVLAHLSDENNYPELALMSVSNVLSKYAIEAGKDVLIDVAVRKKITQKFRL